MIPGFEKYRRAKKRTTKKEESQAVINLRSRIGTRSVRASVVRNVDPNDPDITIFTINTPRGVISNRFDYKSINANFAKALESIQGNKARTGKSIKNKTKSYGRSR